MKKLFSTCLIVILIGALSSPLKAQLSSELSNRLQAVLDSVCKQYQVKGASAAVLYPGVGTWKGVHGISHNDVPIHSDMLMGMGSNTKTFISALILKLQENGLLSINDSIGKWIHNKPNINGQITIKQCLNHTSGLFDYLRNAAVNDTLDQNPQKIWQAEELLTLVKEPNFAPGTNWSYSNTNYIIAGMIIEQVTNKSCAQAIQELILTPAGLNNTYFYDPSLADRMPHQWSMNITGTEMTDLNTLSVDIRPFLFSMATSAGAMITTAEDNVLFWHKLVSGEIITEASFRQMTELVNIGSASYGLGIFRYNKRLNQRSFYSHGGTYLGFINDNLSDISSGVCISVLTNQDSITNSRILNSVIGALHKVSIQMPVGLKESAYNSKRFTVYPNPASELVYLKGDEISRNRVTIYDMTGRQQLNDSLSPDGTISLRDLSSGFYLLHITDQSGTLVHVQKLQIAR